MPVLQIVEDHGLEATIAQKTLAMAANIARAARNQHPHAHSTELEFHRQKDKRGLHVAVESPL